MQGGNSVDEKIFYLEEVDKYCSKNRFLVKNLTAIFSYVVSRVLNTMTVYKLRGYYLLLVELRMVSVRLMVGLGDLQGLFQSR